MHAADGASVAHDARSSAGAIDLRISKSPIELARRIGRATAINGTVPGPLLRFREGDEVVIRISNDLAEDTSIHWHGMLVPNPMDGVPKVNFPGIKPGETFTYRFRIRQSGTGWYHSHSGMQLQAGVYAPLVIEPLEPEPYEYDRDHVVMLSDWTFEDPDQVLSKLKKQPDYYNFQKRTAPGFFREASARGWRTAWRERAEWARMRMDPTDLSDITGYTYTYLVNGQPPEDNWIALFAAGERVRLRFINAASVTLFDVRIPGLRMRVVQTDFNDVEPVVVDELRLGPGETFDVIVEPEDRAYTIFAEALDRSGFARGTLAPRPGMSAEVPERRLRPLRSMADMGMVHAVGDMEHGAEHGGALETDTGEALAIGLRPAGTVPPPTPHGPGGHGPGNAAVPMLTKSRLDEPGVGLEDAPWRVLVYADLRRLMAPARVGDRLGVRGVDPGAEEPQRERPTGRAPMDTRPPDREIEMHLTGNMDRFMWSIDGKKFSDAEPIPLRYGERVRVTLVNDTMMEHPMHAHGMFMVLENGAGELAPEKHTIVVKPAERLSFLVEPDEPGPWAFHCHNLFHMEAGMFRVFRVSDPDVTEGG